MENTKLHPCPLCGLSLGYALAWQGHSFKSLDVTCCGCGSAVAECKSPDIWGQELPEGRTPKADEAWNEAGAYAKGLFDQVEALRKAQPDPWQPIATAPKDGTRILAWFPRYGSWEMARWESDSHSMRPRPHWQTGGRISDAQRNPPTHWQPLPAAPEGV